MTYVYNKDFLVITCQSDSFTFKNVYIRILFMLTANNFKKFSRDTIQIRQEEHINLPFTIRFQWR